MCSSKHKIKIELVICLLIEMACYQYCLLVLLIFTIKSVVSLEEEHILYSDIRDANRTDSLLRIKHVPIRTYEFKYDKVEGRKKIGVLGQDAHMFFPESVEVVPSYVLLGKNRSEPSTILENFPLVDKNVIFMHGVVALQELLSRLDTVHIKLEQMQALFINQTEVFDRVRDSLEGEVNQQVIQNKNKVLEEYKLLQKRLDIETEVSQHTRLVDEQQVAEDRRLLEYEEELAKQRMVFQEKVNREKVAALIQLEKEKLEKREALMYENAQQLQAKRVSLERELEASKGDIEISKIKAEIEAKAAQVLVHSYMYTICTIYTIYYMCDVHLYYIYHRYVHTSTLYTYIDNNNFYLILSRIRSELTRTSHCVSSKLKPA